MDFCKEKQYQSLHLSEEFPAILSSLYCTLLSFLLGKMYVSLKEQKPGHKTLLFLHWDTTST